MDEHFFSQGLTADDIKLSKLFLPHSMQKRGEALSRRARFVHYTTASGAASIIEGRSVWLRNATTMNDYSEINFGIDRVVGCLGRKREGETSRAFWALMEQLGEGLPQQVAENYDGWLSDLRLNTFLFSLSEHCSSEDEIGRLSMWRAYGAETGIAIVINGESIHSYSDALETFTYPVFYADDSEAEAHFSTLVSRLSEEREFLSSISSSDLAAWIFTMLNAYSLCLKHPGFREEREWRVVHQPKQNASARVVKKKVEIRGHPQIVYELPLRDVPEANLLGLDPNELINRVIIGPTKYPIALFDYCCEVLAEAGVVEPEKRVFVSHIPLRT